MNKVILIGNLTKDPELKTTQTGKSVTSACVATSKTYVDKNGQKQQLSQFHNLVIWGKPAEAFAKYLKKGKKVSIIGEMQTRNYQANDGTKRYVTEVLVNEFEFLSPAEKREEYQEPTINVDTPYDNIEPEPQDEIDVRNIPF